MGTYAKTDNGQIEFDTHENAEKAFNEFLKVFRDNISFLNNRPGGDFDIDWETTTLGHLEVYVNAQSGREANLRWQIEQIMDFFEKQDGVIEINIPILLQGDCFWWRKDD